MGKAKSSKGDGTQIPNKHIHARLSFLHQAATHLSIAQIGRSSSPKSTQEPATRAQACFGGTPHYQNASDASRLLNHLRGVSRKSQIRLAPEMKHSICKRCDSLLLPGRTSTEVVVNQSRNGRKPWADIFEIRCVICGTIKRFPVGATRKEARQGRPASLAAVEQNSHPVQAPTSAT